MTLSHPAPRRTTPKPPSNLPVRTPARGPSLYELAAEAQSIEGKIAIAADLLGSDDPDQIEQATALLESYLAEEEANTTALLSKADNICHVIDSLSAKASFRAAEAKRLAELAAADERRAERLKANMLRVLGVLRPGERKFSLPLHELTSRSSESIEIEDPDLIPEDLFRTTVRREPDKTQIKAAIKGGVTVPGASLVRKTTWHIR